MEWTTVIGYVFSALTGAVGWLVGRRKQANDFLADLQRSIDMLAEKNSKLLEELVVVRLQNIDLMSNQEAMKRKIDALKRENEELRRELGLLNEKLEGVKTITRKA